METNAQPRMFYDLRTTALSLQIEASVLGAFEQLGLVIWS